MHESTTLPIHPRTGRMAVGIVAGKPVWPILGGSGESDDGGSGDGDGGKGGGTATYTPPTSQADLDRIVEQRLARERAKYADYDTLKEKAARADALDLELASDIEKAAQRSYDDAWSAAMSKAVPRLITAEFKAEAKGVLSSEQLEALLEDVDLTRYADDDGEPDTNKIAAKIAKFAPAKGSGTQPPRPLGQGHQHPAPQSARDLGRAEAEKRFGKKQ